MNKRVFQSLLVASGLAIAIHLDWHAARHGQRLSLGWTYHWLLAVPIFALAAVHTVRAWRAHVVGASVSVLALAVVLGQVVEPLLETALRGSSFARAFSADRLTALAWFIGVGMVVFIGVAWWMVKGGTVAPSNEPTV